MRNGLYDTLCDLRFPDDGLEDPDRELQVPKRRKAPQDFGPMRPLTIRLLTSGGERAQVSRS